MEPSAQERLQLEELAKSMVELCVRNTVLEDFHAGRYPQSRAGDYSDVRVVTPDGEIPWNDLSRISDEEMKTLMIEVVDRVFTYLSFPEVLGSIPGGRTWDRPKLDAALMKTVQRRAGQAAKHSSTD